MCYGKLFRNLEHHENIVQFVTATKVKDGRLVLAMEYVAGAESIVEFLGRVHGCWITMFGTGKQVPFLFWKGFNRKLKLSMA